MSSSPVSSEVAEPQGGNAAHDASGLNPGVDDVDELAEYEPSIPSSGEDDLFPELENRTAKVEGCPGNQHLSHEQRAISSRDPADEGERAPVLLSQEDEWIGDVELEDHLRDLTSGVELVSLRYMVGLKSKTGPEVAAGVQRMILAINKSYPVRVLHCDPGTEFGSDKLSTWLAQQGVRLQTTIPTDKQGKRSGRAHRGMDEIQSSNPVGSRWCGPNILALSHALCC